MIAAVNSPGCLRFAVRWGGADTGDVWGLTMRILDCLEIDDIRESQNFVSEMARRYDGHR